MRTQRTRRTQNLRYLEIICLHRLADMVQVTPLQNNLLRALYMMNNKGITPQFDDLLEASQMLPSDCSFLALLLSYWTYHIDLEWFQSSSTHEILASAPELRAKSTARYAGRLHKLDEESLFDQVVEKHFTHPLVLGGENSTSMTAVIN